METNCEINVDDWMMEKNERERMGQSGRHEWKLIKKREPGMLASSKLNVK